ncbi:uracil-DNA glycosylase [Hyphobacterium sp.]|uniref:uracil-DNA glycosylase n=1 Tax=Hyphobacterium sp. TaxID=2004662 RepID=UPI0037487FC5
MSDPAESRMFPTMPEADTRSRALKALTGWWEDMGIEAELAPPAKPKRLAPAAAPERPPRDPLQTPQKPAIATPQAAQAAGFGTPDGDPEEARKAVARASTLDELKAAIEAFDGCALKRTARKTVFARGNPEAAIMIVGEAPGRDEDEQGKPFVGKAGQLLDRMIRASGLDPETDVYISNVLNWRPSGNRTPSTEETAICLPLIERHIALANPKILVFAGGVSAQALLRATTGIMKLRGRWSEYRVKDADGEAGEHIPAMPIFHPAFLLRRPQEKARAWRDWLEVVKKVEGV